MPDQTPLPEVVDRTLESLRFDAYAARPVDHAALRRELFALLERVIGHDVPPQEQARLRAAVAEHLALEATKLRFYDGVSAARADRDTTWEREDERIRAESTGVGAVHLELGVWTAFPAERQRELAERDGLAEFIRLDFDPQYELDVVGDARALPFADGSIDRIHADSVLEHVPHPHAVIGECFRVLRPGGAIRFVTPFAFNLHGYPDDYLRYTPSWYTQICRETGFDYVLADTESARGLYYVLHNSAKTAIVDPDDPAAPALRALHMLVIELLGALVPFDNGFQNGARHWFHSTCCLARKPGPYEPSRRARDWDRPFVERALDLLACPETHKPLKREGDALVAPNGRRYPIRDGIPDFTAAHGRSRIERLARWVPSGARSALAERLARLRRRLG